MATKIAIAGINGRMGREVLAASCDEPDVEVVAGLARAESKTDALEVPCVWRVSELPAVDVLIDFTTPTSVLGIACAAADRGIPVVSGVTGLSEEQISSLRELGSRVPVFHARNFSIGLTSLLQFLPTLVEALDGYDVEIVEAHHRHKADAPSGTALALAEAIGGRPNSLVCGRRGVARRETGEIGIHAIRGGGNIGEHTILIMNEGEEIRIGHRAYSRRTFAQGALRAAQFIADRPTGFYGMADLLAHRSQMVRAICLAR